MEVNACSSLYRCVKAGHVVRGTKEGVGGIPLFTITCFYDVREKVKRTNGV